MKYLFLTLLTLIYSSNLIAQKEKSKSSKEVNIYFEDSKIDTINLSAEKIFEHTITVIAPPQFNQKGNTVKLVLLDNDIIVNKINLLFPVNNNLNIDSTKEVKVKFKIESKKTIKADRKIILGLTAIDSSGKSLKLKKEIAPKEVFIKYHIPLKKNWNNEFWLFTGTNLDLLDGPKAKDLYFMGSYLQNLALKKKPSSNWFYITFGKNRYFSEIDSTSTFSYRNILKNTGQDSFQIESGAYRSERLIKNENIYIEANYLRELKLFSTDNSKFFLSAGVNLGLQNIEEKYTNNNILRQDTSTIRLSPTNFGIPIKTSEVSQEFNTNASLGLLHILASDKMNIKTMVSMGYNGGSTPSIVKDSSRLESLVIKSQKKFFFKTRIDATVLDPGISLGFEIYTRHDRIPQFNVSLSKVFDLQNLGKLFGKVNQISD